MNRDYEEILAVLRRKRPPGDGDDWILRLDDNKKKKKGRQYAVCVARVVPEKVDRGGFRLILSPQHRIQEITLRNYDLPVPESSVVGRGVHEFVVASDQTLLEALLQAGTHCSAEVSLQLGDTVVTTVMKCSRVAVDQPSCSTAPLHLDCNVLRTRKLESDSATVPTAASSACPLQAPAIPSTSRPSCSVTASSSSADLDAISPQSSIQSDSMQMQVISTGDPLSQLCTSVFSDSPQTFEFISPNVSCASYSSSTSSNQGVASRMNSMPMAYEQQQQQFYATPASQNFVPFQPVTAVQGVELTKSGKPKKPRRPRVAKSPKPKAPRGKKSGATVAEPISAPATAPPSFIGEEMNPFMPLATSTPKSKNSVLKSLLTSNVRTPSVDSTQSEPAGGGFLSAPCLPYFQQNSSGLPESPVFCTQPKSFMNTQAAIHPQQHSMYQQVQNPAAYYQVGMGQPMQTMVYTPQQQPPHPMHMQPAPMPQSMSAQQCRTAYMQSGGGEDYVAVSSSSMVPSSSMGNGMPRDPLDDLEPSLLESVQTQMPDAEWSSYYGSDFTDFGPPPTSQQMQHPGMRNMHPQAQMQAMQPQMQRGMPPHGAPPPQHPAYSVAPPQAHQQHMPPHQQQQQQPPPPQPRTGVKRKPNGTFERANKQQPPPPQQQQQQQPPQRQPQYSPHPAYGNGYVQHSPVVTESPPQPPHQLQLHTSGGSMHSSPGHLSPYQYDKSPTGAPGPWSGRRPPSRSELVRMELRHSLQAKQQLASNNAAAAAAAASSTAASSSNIGTAMMGPSSSMGGIDPHYQQQSMQPSPQDLASSNRQTPNYQMPMSNGPPQGAAPPAQEPPPQAYADAREIPDCFDTEGLYDFQLQNGRFDIENDSTQRLVQRLLS